MAADPITADTAAELLNYDLSDDDPFNDNPTISRDDKPTLSPRGTKRKNDDDKENFLGLDDEVTIKKKRKPTVKLDEARVLSAPGIPKLREIARSTAGVTRKLRMKGKGHEFTDVAKLLNFYQLWLDGLYPRAKFADGLQLIEKVGHSKRMQVMRKEWIDEGKPGYIRPGTELVESILNGDFQSEEKAGHNGQPMRTQTSGGPQVEEDDMFFPSPSKAGRQESLGAGDPDDEELVDLLAAQSDRPLVPSKHTNVQPDSEGEDDLDALLAEQDSLRQSGPLFNQTRRPAEADDGGDDDLDALLAEQESRIAASDQTATTRPTAHSAIGTRADSSSRPSSSHSASKRKQAIFDDADSEGEDDLDALLADQEARKRHSTPPTSPHDRAEAHPEPVKSSQHEAKGDSQATVAKIFSSSPLRNDSYKDGLGMKIHSSSPLPNNPEEEDDLDALLAEEGM